MFHKGSYKTIGMSIIVMVMLTCLFSCHRKQKIEKVGAVLDRAAMPVLSADTVITLISDSGIVRYRIETPKWEIFDKATPAYWEFPEGVYLDRFNIDLEVQASLEADYAHYNETDKIWYLRGNVKALNLEGEQFETPEMYWEEKTEKVYSDTTIKIIKKESIITGVGFESNQEMTKYTILHPQGIFPIDDK